LKRIDSFARQFSSLQTIIIPRKVELIDGSAFYGMNIDSISLEGGNATFDIKKDFLIDIVHQTLI
jgi:hypothetical protein